MPVLSIRKIMIATAIVAINFAAFRYPFGIVIPLVLLFQSVVILLAVRLRTEISISRGCILVFAFTLLHAFCICLYFATTYRMKGIAETVLHAIVYGLGCWPYAVVAAVIWAVTVRMLEFYSKHFRSQKRFYRDNQFEREAYEQDGGKN